MDRSTKKKEEKKKNVKHSSAKYDVLMMIKVIIIWTR